MKNKMGENGALYFSAILAELVMIWGYYLYESILYGAIPSAANIIPNSVQATAGIVIGIILIKIAKKYKLM